MRTELASYKYRVQAQFARETKFEVGRILLVPSHDKSENEARKLAGNEAIVP